MESEWTPLQHVSIGGLRVATASRAELTEAMIADCAHARAFGGGRRPRLVFDSNGHAISLRQTDSSYRAAMDRADVVHADGGFVVLASKWLAAARIGDRSVTTDVIHDFAKAASAHGFSFYLLGGTEEVNALCAERLQGMYPDLIIAGRHHGYFDEAQKDSVIDDINRARPDILWVGLGKPREQIFCAETKDRLNVTWSVTCGGCFNYITGHYGRAPRWMQDNHLEWLYRAATDPKKFFWRYASTSPHAIWLALTKADSRRYPDATLE